MIEDAPDNANLNIQTQIEELKDSTIIVQRISLGIIYIATAIAIASLIYYSIMLNKINVVTEYQDVHLNFDNVTVNEIKDNNGLKLYTYIEIYKIVGNTDVVTRDASLGYSWHILPEYDSFITQEYINKWKKNFINSGIKTGKLSKNIVELKNIAKYRCYQSPPNTDGILVVIILSSIWMMIVIIIFRVKKC